jgi:hypothetical protein
MDDGDEFRLLGVDPLTYMLGSASVDSIVLNVCCN